MAPLIPLHVLWNFSDRLVKHRRYFIILVFALLGITGLRTLQNEPSQIHVSYWLACTLKCAISIRYAPVATLSTETKFPT